MENKASELQKKKNAKSGQTRDHLKTNDGFSRFWLYIISSRSRPNESKIGIAKFDIIERYKNLSTAAPNLYVHAAFLLPGWYVGTIEQEEKRWHNFFSAPTTMCVYDYGGSRRTYIDVPQELKDDPQAVRWNVRMVQRQSTGGIYSHCQCYENSEGI